MIFYWIDDRTLDILIAMLKRIEWRPVDEPVDNTFYCPECHQEKSNGHTEDCLLSTFANMEKPTNQNIIKIQETKCQCPCHTNGAMIHAIPCCYSAENILEIVNQEVNPPQKVNPPWVANPPYETLVKIISMLAGKHGYPKEYMLNDFISDLEHYFGQEVESK